MKTKPAWILLFAIVAAIMLSACWNQIYPGGHTCRWGDWEVTAPATCSDEGLRTRTCDFDSSHIKTEPIAIDPDGHDWGEWEVTTPPTATESGAKRRTCAHDPSHVETRAVPATGEPGHAHDWGGWAEKKQGIY